MAFNQKPVSVVIDADQTMFQNSKGSNIPSLGSHREALVLEGIPCAVNFTVVRAADSSTGIDKCLSALVQLQRGSYDSFIGATGIIEDFVKLRQKSENELTDSRKATCSAKHKFDISAQYLRD